MTVAIQGGLGSYSHIAAQTLFPNSLELIQCQSFQQTFDTLTSGQSRYAVIPFENSTHGSVNENYDLITQNNLHIINEIYLKINFHLIGLPGSTIGDIKNLYTHKVSILQIRKFLNQHPSITTHVHSDNGRAVEHIKQLNQKQNAAAASRLAAKIYNMQIIQENIHDNSKNYTRFFVLSSKPEFHPNSNKTTLQFEVEHKPGSLVNVLQEFQKLDINLSKIESRPILNTQWEYRFYIDFQAGLNQLQTQQVLTKINRFTKSIRILGTYPNGIYIET